MELSEQLTGTILRRNTAGFAAEAAAHNRAVVHRPDLIIGAERPEDVAAAVRFARQRQLEVAVQCTGHGALVPVEHGVLVTTRRLDGLELDLERRTVTVGAGLRWSRVITAVDGLGLTPVIGSTGSVGVVGYLLGGGLGPLIRSHGVSSDYLVSADVVVGTGEIVRAAGDSHQDLFWALRGARTGLGIVTAATVRLVELETLYGGALYFAAEHIATVVDRWLAWTATADPEVTTSIAVYRYPRLDWVPRAFRGRTVLALRFAYPGSVERGVELAAPLREWAPIHLDQLAALPAVEMARIHNDPTSPGPFRAGGVLLDRGDPGLADALLTQIGPQVVSPFAVIEMRHLGGAGRYDVPETSAVSGRAADFVLNFVCASPPAFHAAAAASDAMLTALQPWVSGESLTSLIGNLSSDRLPRPWSPEVEARVDEIRRRYDPDGVFRS